MLRRRSSCRIIEHADRSRQSAVDTRLLHHLVGDMAAVVESRDGEIERLQLIIKKLQRAQFGRSLRAPRSRSPAAEKPSRPIPYRPREDVLLDVGRPKLARCAAAGLHASARA